MIQELNETKILGGVCKQIPGGSNVDAVVVSNDFGSDLAIYAMTIRYKTGLENVTCTLKKDTDDKAYTGGSHNFRSLGSEDGVGTRKILFPKKKPILKKGQKIILSVFTPVSTTIHAGDVTLSIEAEFIKI